MAFSYNGVSNGTPACPVSCRYQLVFFGCMNVEVLSSRRTSIELLEDSIFMLPRKAVSAVVREVHYGRHQHLPASQPQAVIRRTMWQRRWTIRGPVCRPMPFLLKNIVQYTKGQPPSLVGFSFSADLVYLRLSQFWRLTSLCLLVLISFLQLLPSGLSPCMRTRCRHCKLRPPHGPAQTSSENVPPTLLFSGSTAHAVFALSLRIKTCEHTKWNAQVSVHACRSCPAIRAVVHHTCLQRCAWCSSQCFFSMEVAQDDACDSGFLPI